MSDDGTLPVVGLRGWFGKLRRRRWIALFFFEFLVVLLGVLVAQALAAKLSERAEQRNADDAIAALRVELGILDREIEKRRRSYLCTIFRLGLMQERIGGDETAIPHRMFHPPTASLTTFAGWDSATISSMRRYLEPDEIQTIVQIGELSNQLEALQRDEREAWNGMHLISDDLGEPSEADLSAAKRGLVAGKLAIGSIFTTSQSLREGINALGVESDFTDFEKYRDAADTCDQLMGYTMDEQGEFLRKRGRLITGQRVDEYYERSEDAREDAAAKAAGS